MDGGFAAIHLRSRLLHVEDAEDGQDANGGIVPGFGLKVTVVVVEALVAVQPEALTAIGALVTVSVPLPLL